MWIKSYQVVGLLWSVFVNSFLLAPLSFIQHYTTPAAAALNQMEDGDYVFVPDSKFSKFNRVIEAFRSLLPGFTIT
jgi:hypothetical protein